MSRHYITFSRKSDNTIVSSRTMDEEICAHLGTTPDEKKYVAGWYHSIGIPLAGGQSIDTIRANFQKYIVTDLSEMREICFWREIKESDSVYFWKMKVLDFIEATYNYSTLPA